MLNVIEYIVGGLVLAVSLLIIAIVLLQQGRRAGINGAISGAADSFLSKNKARTWDAKLAKSTKFMAILFFLLIIAANFIALRK